MADQVTTSLAQAKVLVMQGMAGKAPRINADNNHWEVYDNDTQAWVDTGVAATGDDGYTPTITASQTTGGVLLTISDGRPGGVINTYFIRDGAAGADGEGGRSPYINSTGYWVFWNDSTGAWVTTNYKAAGTNGEDGHSPYIGQNGHWFAWSEQLAMFDDTGTAAHGQDAYSPHIGNDGYWYEWDDRTQEWMNTNVEAQGPQGATGATGATGTTGPQGPQGPQGDSYVLTNQDKTDIAGIVLQALPTWNGGAY